MDPRVRITTVTPEEFWAHGYRIGYGDGANGRAHRLDGLGRKVADVIELRPRTDAVAAEG
ncbi:MAG: hypothetical protein BGO26_10080 [Actinobacteria bacterium 69-20]|nr:hypothetical protein [Actinomycetota bacterium]OJV23246.1 MAG: hypothetical protein BGO26_10080 [Actinobacteria bacterium 69-20]